MKRTSLKRASSTVTDSSLNSCCFSSSLFSSSLRYSSSQNWISSSVSISFSSNSQNLSCFLYLLLTFIIPATAEASEIAVATPRNILVFLLIFFITASLFLYFFVLIISSTSAHFELKSFNDCLKLPLRYFRISSS